MDRLSGAVPLIARVYPNGAADVNAFEAAGGMAFVIRELITSGHLHADILTAGSPALADSTAKPMLEGDALTWRDPGPSGDDTILRTPATAFSPDGGMRILAGNIGRACIKVSAVDRDRWIVEAPAAVFADQATVLAAFQAGELDRDVVVVVRFQGPRANGMPELHKLTPPLGVLQNRGYRVALVTDGRMSGASGKVPCAIHVSPEALPNVHGIGGAIGLIRDGDMIRVDAVSGTLDMLVDADTLAAREQPTPPRAPTGMGRELLGMFRMGADEAEKGASAMLAGAAL
jgi:phosphogluconate dehydratase